jgi:hypothetical protein
MESKRRLSDRAVILVNATNSVNKTKHYSIGVDVVAKKSVTYSRPRKDKDPT